VVMSAATHSHRVEGWQGAPQTIYTDHFLETQPIDGAMGYKLEAPPIHPLIFASSIPGYGQASAALLKGFAHQHILLALLRDGFAPGSPGGRVSLRSDGSPLLSVERVTYTYGDKPVEWRRGLYSTAEHFYLNELN